MFLSVTTPSMVAVDLPLAPSGSRAQAVRLREAVAPVHMLGQGTSLPIDRSLGSGRELVELAWVTECATTTTSVPTTSDVSYLTQQPAITDAFKGVRPGVRSWSPPD